MKLKDTYKAKQEWRDMVFQCVSAANDEPPKALTDNPVDIISDLIAKHVNAVKRSMEAT